MKSILYKTNNITKENTDFFTKHNAYYYENKDCWVIDAEKYPEETKLLKEYFRNLWSSWENAFTKTKDNVYLLYQLKEIGFPLNHKQRQTLFEAFNRRNIGDYPITMTGLIDYYPDITNIYDIDALCEKIPDILNGSADYENAINNSNLSEEEKALTMLMFPLEEVKEEDLER